LAGCAACRGAKLDPALEGFSKENLTVSRSECDPRILEGQQITWIDDTTVRMTKTLSLNCSEWIDVGYRLEDDELMVKIIDGYHVSKDGGRIVEKCICGFEVSITISDLPKGEYRARLLRSPAAEPRIVDW
jgi:hypothetical protein